MKGIFISRHWGSILPILLIWVGLGFGIAQGQPRHDRKIWRIAERAFYQGDYDYFLTLNARLSSNFSTQQSQLLKGLALYEVRELAAAKSVFESIQALDSAGLAEASLYLALIDKSFGRYVSAISRLKNLKALPAQKLLTKERLHGQKKYLNFDENKAIRQMEYKIQAEIAACQYAQSLSLARPNGKVRRLSYTINDIQSELAPVYVDSLTIYYSSLKEDSADNPDGGNVHFTASRIKQAILQFDDYAPDNEVRGLQHDFTSLINGNTSEDGARLFYTKVKQKSFRKQFSIYEARFADGKYKRARRLPHPVNARGSNNSQPNWSYLYWKGKKRPVLFFASDRADGHGGKDIWYSLKDTLTDRWLDPINAGPSVNTAGNEITPWFDASTQQLYFSSDRQLGLGGYDVFQSFYNQERFTIGINLGMPINSGFDETYFSTVPGKKQGFFSSNRPRPEEQGTCCDDIFEAFLPDNEGVVSERLIAGYNGYKPALVIYYATNAEEPNAKGKQAIDSMITTALVYKHKHLVVKGHTDNVGSVSYNAELSKRRVDFVKSALIKGKVNPSRITTAALDMREPRVPYEKLEGEALDRARSFNRRVEIYLISQ